MAYGPYAPTEIQTHEGSTPYLFVSTEHEYDSTLFGYGSYKVTNTANWWVALEDSDLIVNNEEYASINALAAVNVERPDNQGRAFYYNAIYHFLLKKTTVLLLYP